MEPLPEYCSLEEFSHISGLSVSTLRRRIKDGSLPHKQLGGRRCRLLIPRDALDKPEQLLDSGLGTGNPDRTGESGTPTSSPLPQGLPGKRPQWMQHRTPNNTPGGD